MRSINFSTGIREYAVNGDENNTIRVNLSDLNIMKRAEEAMENAAAMQEKYSGIKTPASEQLAEMDAEIRKQFNYAFGTDICTPAFGQMNCLSPVGDGKPLFQAFFEAFLPLIKEDIAAMKPQKNELRPEVQKYLESEGERTDGIDIDSLTKEQKNALLEKLLS